MTTVTVKNRIMHRFSKWDANDDGFLDRSDMEQEAEEIVRAFGKDPSSPEAQAIKRANAGLFDLLAGLAGVAADGRLNAEQFRSSCEKLIFEQGEAAFNRALTPLVQGIIRLCDRNDDGMINRSEFRSWLSVFGHSADDADETFEQIDKDGNDELTTDELLGAIRDYHFGRLNADLIAT